MKQIKLQTNPQSSHRLAMLDQWLDRIEAFHSKSIDMGLDRSRQVYSRLLAAGLFPTTPLVVTIGGTNGKGTTLKLLENAAIDTGFSVGSYTSPHLFVFNERVRLNGNNAQDSKLVHAFEVVEQYRGDIPLTYYEFTTLAAFVVMAAEKLDVWLIEVGLGGRLDTVNLLDAHIAVITSIALDHEAFLGSTREAIAAEKIEIARKGRPVFLGGQDVPESIQQYCNAQQIECFDYTTRQIETSEDSPSLLGSWSLGLKESGQVSWLSGLPIPKIPLQNAALGLQVWIAMARSLQVQPWSVTSPQALLEKTALFGRFSKLDTDAEIWVDAAHNPAAAALLATSLDSLSARPTTAICGIMADKDVEGTLKPLLCKIDRWMLVTLDMERALPPQDLQHILIDLGVSEDKIEICANLDMNRLDEHIRYLVFGSFLTIELVACLARIDG